MVKKNQIDISSFSRLYPFKSHFLYINGLKYHYLDQGSGDPVVMIHGNPTWSFYFRNLIEELSSRFRIIAPDHIGCGLSDKPDIRNYGFRLKNRLDDLEALIRHLDLKKKITLILHDWGGMIGMAYALKHREKIGRIIIMNTAAFFPPKGKSLPIRLWLIRNIRPFATIAVLGFNLFVQGAAFMASCKRLPEEVRSGLTAPYNCWNNRIAVLKFVQDIPASENDPSFRYVKHVDENLHRLRKIPMLICWGKKDFVFDESYLAKWRRRFPDAKVHLFPKSGHYLLEDSPDKIADLVKNFLKKNPLSISFEFQPCSQALPGNGC